MIYSGSIQAHCQNTAKIGQNLAKKSPKLGRKLANSDQCRQMLTNSCQMLAKIFSMLARILILDAVQTCVNDVNLKKECKSMQNVVTCKVGFEFL